MTTTDTPLLLKGRWSNIFCRQIRFSFSNRKLSWVQFKYALLSTDGVMEGDATFYF